MEEKLDIRIQRTYAALTETFLQMMREMPFEDIRISELCEPIDDPQIHVLQAFRR